MVDLPDVFVLEHEPPDVVRLAVKGVIQAEHVGPLFDRLDQLVAELPFWMFEVDIAELGGADSDTRRVAANRLSRLPPYSMAVCGGDFSQRTIARLFFAAVELLFRDRGNRHKICTERSEARAWLASEAQRHRSRSRTG